MILINRTYAILTEESVQDGDIAESGFLAKNESVTFRELVGLMESHYMPSSMPIQASGYITWFSSEPDQDFETGDYESTAIHYSRDNPDRKLKYWLKAAKCAGFDVR
jgi:hypothetical protein